MDQPSNNPPELYAILLEWQKEGVCNNRRIILGENDRSTFTAFAELVREAGELVYEADMFSTSHHDLVEVFSERVEGYPIPDGDEDALGGVDIFPALELLLKNEERKLEQGAMLVEVVTDCNSFLDSANYFLWDKSYVAVTRQGWLPEFGNQLIERELGIFRDRHRMEGVWEEKACWFGRLSMLMAIQKPWLGSNAYDPLLELIDEFNEAHMST